MNKIANDWRLWLYRDLVAAGAATMLIAFILPWWIGRFSENSAIYIYGWGLRHNLVSLADYVAEDTTPVWQTALAWIYIGISVALALLSTRLSKWRGSLLLGILGAGMMAYAFVAVHMVITNRLADFNIALEGFSGIYKVSIYASLEPGYTLAYIAGGIWLCAAGLRRVAERKQLGSPHWKHSELSFEKIGLIPALQQLILQ